LVGTGALIDAALMRRAADQVSALERRRGMKGGIPWTASGLVLGLLHPVTLERP